MPERMNDFFAARVDGYDAHMLTNIEGMREAYRVAAQQLPDGISTLLDLGCGTGLELGAVFERFPTLQVTGIDLTQEMLDQLAAKYGDKSIRLVCGDYFAVDFGHQQVDAVLSVESLHHFTHAQKATLYRKIWAALRPGGVFVNADYMVDTQAEEDAFFRQRQDALAHQADADGYWHYDTPLAIANERHLLQAAGFQDIMQPWRCANTAILVAHA